MDYTQIEKIKEKLKKDLNPQRYEHTLRTVLKAMELGVGSKADKEVVFIAALLHDCAKYKIPSERQKSALSDFVDFEPIIHAPFGAIVAQEEYGISDERILNAIKYHTTGRAGMTIEEMIVFLADAIEDGREYPNLVNIKENTKKSIKHGVLTSLEGVVSFESSKGTVIHHLTLEAIRDIKENI